MRWQRLTEGSLSVAQTVTRLILAAVRPQEGSELVAGMRLPGREAEVREQGLGLPAGQGQSYARAEPGLEAAEKREPQRHGASTAVTHTIAQLRLGPKPVERHIALRLEGVESGRRG